MGVEGGPGSPEKSRGSGELGECRGRATTDFQLF